jgi:CDGSH-type Zn-finger protein
MDKRVQITEEQVPCGCGRSPSGFCVGLHSMTEEEYQAYLGSDDIEWPDNPAE